jgi:hypothetical protein
MAAAGEQVHGATIAPQGRRGRGECRLGVLITRSHFLLDPLNRTSPEYKHFGDLLAFCALRSSAASTLALPSLVPVPRHV